MRRFRRILPACTGALLAASLAAAGVTVELRESAAVHQAYVRLGQVADVRGQERASTRIARLFLGPAPAEGRARRMSREQIRGRLEEVGLATDVTFAGARTVLIERAEAPRAPARQAATASERRAAPAQPDGAAEAEPTRLQALVAAAVRDHVARIFPRKDLSVRVRVESVDGTLPQEAVQLRMRRVVRGRVPGRAQVELDLRDADGKARGWIQASVEVAAFARVLMLRRRLRRGETVTPADLIVQEAALESGTAYLPLAPQAVADCEAARSLRAMEPLEQGDVERPAAVFKGQRITVASRAGGFRIHMKVLALADAALGDRVFVENPNGAPERRRFLVRVTGVGEAVRPSEARR